MTYAAPYKLQIARQKLQATNVPFLLRTVSFLRLSCTALPAKDAYSRLMKMLFAHDPQWWTKCEITAHGDLYSTDRTINRYLKPIQTLHRPILRAKAA